MSPKINITRLKNKIFNQIDNNFAHLSNPQRKWLKKMVFGLLKSNDLKLTNITRAIKSNLSLKMELKNLDKMLNNFNWQKIVLPQHYKNSGIFSKNEIIAIDHTDISKTYSKCQEGLINVRDGSSKTNKTNKGFRLINVTRHAMNSRVPELINMEIIDNEDTMTITTINLLKEMDRQFGFCGIRVLDRGFDIKDYYHYFEDNNISFVIRGKKNRLVRVSKSGTTKGKKQNIMDVAQNLKTIATVEKWFYKNGKKSRLANLRIGATEIFVSGVDMFMNMVVIKDPKRNLPMILLTNQEINLNNIDEIINIYNQYLERWKCEEVIRYIKQEYGLEDIRYQKLQNIKDVIALMVYADSFISRTIGSLPKMHYMKDKIITRAKALKEDCKFTLYRIRHGLRNIFEGVVFENIYKKIDIKNVLPSFTF
jgi:hypothetical protein